LENTTEETSVSVFNEVVVVVVVVGAVVK